MKDVVDLLLLEINLNQSDLLHISRRMSNVELWVCCRNCTMKYHFDLLEIGLYEDNTSSGCNIYELLITLKSRV